MMQTLSLEPGDLLQIKSTDLPSGSFIKLQPQSMSFINAISDPKAVLENALRNFSALTVGDKFQFDYNDDVFEIAVLEAKPQNSSNAISVLETDLEVDFAPPLDYVEPVRSTPGSAGSSRPGSVVSGRTVTPITQEGSMAKSIGYSALSAATAAANAPTAFSGSGQRLKSSRAGTPLSGRSTNAIPPPPPPTTAVRKTGPQPLRLPPGKLFFGYTIKPVKASGDKDAEEKKPSMFSSGGGQTLRAAATRKRKGEESKGKGKSKDAPIELD
jgi:ubiquitin fusion degradation protein 1